VVLFLYKFVKYNASSIENSLVRKKGENKRGVGVEKEYPRTVQTSLIRRKKRTSRISKNEERR